MSEVQNSFESEQTGRDDLLDEVSEVADALSVFLGPRAPVVSVEAMLLVMAEVIASDVGPGADPSTILDRVSAQLRGYVGQMQRDLASDVASH